VVVTIFVNPTQFGPNEDLSRYPRTLEADVAACRDRGASVVFTPDAQAMYPAGDEARVRVGATASPLCGAHRPGHFEGVATVVAKLFALVGPCVAVFGRKDFQQVRVIERMATDLFFPVEIVAMPTVREPDGLALSSRNRYLSEPERARALAIVRALSLAARAHAKGERSRDALLALAKSELAPNATSIDYVELADPRTLAPVLPGQMVGDRVLFAVAARVGSTRLIDNLVLGEEEPPIGAPHP
jgi:pantoate--beta-alanine ligase